MAWQLIYTSAPRSLEAGRSGFGTVARHRAISPLLVSAIERASQFSRLPGTDSGRVIFSHRIVAVAGGRFHVLSAIRDAGADYTGRTNHIAHHLIVDPREIAQLGPDGPSPADVLLSMRWAASWNEPPRFLEASDEVALSAIHPHTNGSAWEQITGSANQAWLLATGDASRGAYIIQPGSADLRAVYAESLRLIPDRLWQISFTTSLQPSDEPGDFRWIGIEERSPLRAQSESSGRPVLNLALPDTLPLVETVQRPAVSQIRQNSEPASAPAWNDLPTASTETSPVVSGSHSSPTRQRTAITPSASSTRSSRISPKWWLLTGAVVAVSIVGMVVFSMFVNPYLEKQKARNAMAESFATTGYFSNDTSRKLANALVISADDSKCKELAGASNALIQILLDGELQKLKPEFTSDSLKVLASRDGLQLPEELGNLRETVKEAQRLSDKPPKVEEARDINDLISIIKKRHDEITEWAPGKSLQELVGALHANANQQQAEGMLTIVQQRMPPPGGIKSFKEIVTDFKAHVSDQSAKNTIIQVEKLLDEQVAKLQTTPRSEPPDRNLPPPTTKAEIVAVKPTAPSQVPLFLHTIDTPPLLIKLPGVPSDNFTYSIIDAENKPALLQDHKKDGNLRLGVQETIFKLGHLTPLNEFEVGKPFTHVELQKYASKFPLRLLTHKDDKSEAFRFWFIHQTSQKPLLEHPLHSEDGITELRNNGTMIVVNQNAIQLPGKLQESVWLETPDEFMPGSKAAIYPLMDMHLDLSEIIRRLNEQRTTILKQRDLIQIPVRETVFKQFEESAKRQLSEEGSKKYSTSKPVNDIQRCGAMLEQYAYDITHIGLNSSSKIPIDKMKKCGAALLKANQEFEKITNTQPATPGPEYAKELENKNK